VLDDKTKIPTINRNISNPCLALQVASQQSQSLAVEAYCILGMK